jgi:hypothetical protein
MRGADSFVNRFGKALFWLAVWWLWIPAVLLIGWGLSEWITPGMGTYHLAWEQWLDRIFWTHSGWMWVYIMVGLIGSLAILFVHWDEPSPRRTQTYSSYDHYGSPRRQPAEDQKPQRTKRSTDGTTLGILSVLLVGALVFSFVQWLTVIVSADKKIARYGNSATTFVVPSLKNPPKSADRLFDRNPKGSGSDCTLRGPKGDDVPACIIQGTLPLAGWEPRVASLDGAKIVMKRTSGNTPGVNLNQDTITYLNAHGGEKAKWSAIRDGSGKYQPMDGVVEWTGGTDKPTECSFSKKDKDGIDRAISGDKGNSLPNLLNDRFPKFNFTMSDSWGYCHGSHPVIVFPVQKQIHWKNQTVKAPAGVVIMRGSASGHAVFQYQATVKAGELPGPVYPASEVANQRDAIKWAAGRKVREGDKLTFDPADSPAQEGNVSEYLLRSAVDGRLYWVTPLTPNGDNELFVAYSVTPADQVNNGQLNRQKVYMLADNDPRMVNLDNLLADAKTYLSTEQPGFISAGGKIVEFLPTGSKKAGDKGDEWQAYGEINGRVAYRLDLTATGWLTPTWVALEPKADDSGSTGNGSGGNTTPTPGAVNCGKPAKDLSQSDLVTCLQQFANELSHRQTAGAGKS